MKSLVRTQQKLWPIPPKFSAIDENQRQRSWVSEPAQLPACAFDLRAQWSDPFSGSGVSFGCHGTGALSDRSRIRQLFVVWGGRGEHANASVDPAIRRAEERAAEAEKKAAAALATLQQVTEALAALQNQMQAKQAAPTSLLNVLLEGLPEERHVEAEPRAPEDYAAMFNVD